MTGQNSQRAVEHHLHATPAGPPRFPFGALTTVGFPAGAANANLFSFFNAINWGIVLGAPLILYAKSLGASALVLGVIAAVMPLMTTLQMPAAHWLPHLGYRRLMMLGWTSRTLCVFGLAAVTLLPGPAELRLSLVVLLMVMFTVLRGLASGAYMPWMSELIPDSIRGRFFSRDQFFGQTGALVTLLAAAVALQGRTRPWQYGLAFLISALGGVSSVLCLRRIPEVATPEQMRRSGARVPWAAMLLFRPFFRLIVFNVLFALAVAALPVFSVAYLRGEEGYSDSSIVLLAVLAGMGAVLTLPWSGAVMDRVGSKPVFAICLGACATILTGWWAMAAGVLPPTVPVVGGLYFVSGFAGVNFAVANARMQSVTIPLMGRNHFFALFTVITSVAAGVTPVFWGAVLDGIGAFTATSGPVQWNKYSIFFGAATLLCLITLVYALWLEEAPAEARGPDGVPPVVCRV